MGLFRRKRNCWTKEQIIVTAIVLVFFIVIEAPNTIIKREILCNKSTNSCSVYALDLASKILGKEKEKMRQPRVSFFISSIDGIRCESREKRVKRGKHYETRIYYKLYLKSKNSPDIFISDYDYEGTCNSAGETILLRLKALPNNQIQSVYSY